MERTRKIQSEKNVQVRFKNLSHQDMQSIRTSQEINLKAVNEQQSLSLAAITKDLVKANETVEIMSSKIRNYELQLSLKKTG